MKIKFLHGYHLWVTTTSSTTFNTKSWTLWWLTNRCYNALGKTGTKCLTQTNSCCWLPFTKWCRINATDNDKRSILDGRETLRYCEWYLWREMGKDWGKKRGKEEGERRGSKVEMNWKWMVSGLNGRRRKKWRRRREEKEEEDAVFFFFSFSFSLWECPRGIQTFDQHD